MGGTFDPVHYGHLRLAEEAAEHLALEGVRWIPSGSPGHRAAPRTAAHHRLEMVRLAIQSNIRFTLDASEAHATTPQFTIDTLRRLRGELGDALPLMLIIGADQLYKLDTWRAWRDLFALAHCAVGERPGYRARARAASLDGRGGARSPRGPARRDRSPVRGPHRPLPHDRARDLRLGSPASPRRRRERAVFASAGGSRLY